MLAATVASSDEFEEIYKDVHYFWSKLIKTFIIIIIIQQQ